MLKEENQMASQPNIILWSPEYVLEKTKHHKAKYHLRRFSIHSIIPTLSDNHPNSHSSIFIYLTSQLGLSINTLLRKTEKKAD